MKLVDLRLMSSMHNSDTALDKCQQTNKLYTGSLDYAINLLSFQIFLRNCSSYNQINMLLTCVLVIAKTFIADYYINVHLQTPTLLVQITDDFTNAILTPQMSDIYRLRDSWLLMYYAFMEHKLRMEYIYCKCK